jgi:prepilin-type processing-associated H-X9-DG protein
LIVPVLGVSPYVPLKAAGVAAEDEIAGPGATGERTSGKAIASLVLGLMAIPCSLTILFGLVSGVLAIVFGSLGLGEIDRGKGRVKGRGMALTGIITGALACTLFPIAICVALLLPAVQAAREAARRAQCVNNLKQIGLAMHNFLSAENHFPPSAIKSADGKPLLSWRVAMLPYLENEPLYREFKLDEPWDSPHNKALVARMPKVYACPSDPATDPTITHYQVIAGPRTLFEGPTGVPISEVTDGTSNTLMVVEAAAGVPWTKPDDLAYIPDGTLPVLGSQHAGGENALFADGSVRFLKRSLAAPTLESLITRNGGEVVPAGSY